MTNVKVILRLSKTFPVTVNVNDPKAFSDFELALIYSTARLQLESLVDKSKTENAIEWEIDDAYEIE